MVDAGEGVYKACLGLTVAQEGGLSLDPRDKGNWTGGRVGLGELRGTKWGLSAASYPGLDFALLTREEMEGIYHRDYWIPGQCHKVPGPLAALMFDSAVNNGLGAHRQVQWVQQTLRTHVDGLIGPVTQGALRAFPRDDLLAGFQKRRLLYHTGMQTWGLYGDGWTKRLMLVLLKSQDVEEGPGWER